MSHNKKENVIKSICAVSMVAVLGGLSFTGGWFLPLGNKQTDNATVSDKKKDNNDEKTTRVSGATETTGTDVASTEGASSESADSGTKNKQDIAAIADKCYKDMKDLYDDEDYYNAMTVASNVLDDKDLHDTDAYDEIQDMYDDCYEKMKDSYVSDMERYYKENNVTDYEECRERLQEIYFDDAEVIEEINDNIKDFTTRYMVSSETEEGLYGDILNNTITYTYDDEAGIVSVDYWIISGDLYRPELDGKIEYYYVGAVQFHNPDNVNPQYSTYSYGSGEAVLTYDDYGRVISSYSETYDTDSSSTSNFTYDEDGKCRGWGDDSFRVDLSYNDSGMLSNVHMYIPDSGEECVNVDYYYDEENRLVNYDGFSWNYSESYGRFVYDDENNIVYYYDSADSTEPYSTMYYDERGVCYKEVTSDTEIYYEYREVQANPDFDTVEELYVE